MKIIEGNENQVISYVFSGNYSYQTSGTKGRLYQFSSPSFPITHFEAPYDAYLLNPIQTGNRIAAVGERMRQNCPIQSDRSGVLYFYEDLSLVGACHGFGHNNKTFYNGFNFYNAFYPAGYISPPFG